MVTVQIHATAVKPHGCVKGGQIKAKTGASKEKAVAEQPFPYTNGALYQDAKFGKGMRLMNSTRGGGFRCTVCGNLA